MQAAHASITEQPIDVVDLARLVGDDQAGAVVTFAGVVRDHDASRAVVSLDYSSHPSAPEVLDRIVAEFGAAHPDVTAVAVAHRVGHLTVGDVALGAAVSSAHRAEAFTGLADLVDRVKADLPIWKHQHFADGTAEWSNLH